MDDVVSTVDFRAVGVGLAVALVVFLLIAWIVGLSAILDALRSARLWVLPFVITAAFLWLLVWSFSLDIVLSLLGVPHTRVRSFGTYLGVVFANNITPFAQVGAEPFAALIVSRATNARFEVSLSAVTSVDALNVLPSVGLAAIGLSYFALNTALDPRIELAVILFLGLTILVCLLAFIVWRHRTVLESSLRRVASWVEMCIEGIVSHSERFETPDLEERVAGFVASLERISRNPQQLSIALAFSTVGWLCLMAALWLSLYAIGYMTPLAVVLFIVPLAVVAGVTPSPGGAGGIEATYVFLLVALTPIPIAPATAAVLLYRVGTYLLPIVAGGGAVVILGLTNSGGDGVS